MTAYRLIEGAELPPGGRKRGSRNVKEPNRDVALSEARRLVASGVSKIEAARRAKAQCGLHVEAETIARLL